jgi:hypothetical protein
LYIGDDNFSFIIVLTLSVQAVLAAVMTAEVEPLIIKSLPSAATELHNIGSLKITFSSSGAQPGGLMLSKAVGCDGKTVKDKLSPMGIAASQLSSSVFPSLPFTIQTL